MVANRRICTDFIVGFLSTGWFSSKKVPHSLKVSNRPSIRRRIPSCNVLRLSWRTDFFFCNSIGSAYPATFRAALACNDGLDLLDCGYFAKYASIGGGEWFGRVAAAGCGSVRRRELCGGLTLCADGLCLRRFLGQNIYIRPGTNRFTGHDAVCEVLDTNIKSTYGHFLRV